MKREVYNVYMWHKDIPIKDDSRTFVLKKELDLICLEFGGHPWIWDITSDKKIHQSIFQVRATVVTNNVGYDVGRSTFVMVSPGMEDEELIQRFNSFYGFDAVKYQTNGAQDDIQKYDQIVKRKKKADVSL